MNDKNKIVIIGCGMVGMSSAYAMMIQGIGDELVLIDINQKKAEGEAIDLNHGLAFASKNMNIYAGNYSDCKDAKIVVITAGVNQKEGESRLQLLDRNVAIIRSIVAEVIKSGFSGIFLVGSNPVDILTYVVYKESGFPSHRVIGTGTSLDSARLRYLLSNYLQIDSRNIHAYIIGEHGDSEFAIWKNTHVGGKPLVQILEQHPEYSLSDLNKIYEGVRDAAYEIINKKGATYYAIGLVITHIVRAMINNSNSIIPLSVYIKELYGITDLYIGMPAVLNKDGVRELLDLRLSENDQELWKKSAMILVKVLTDLGIHDD